MMMDDIKLLIDALSGLEYGALYLVAGFLLYKLATLFGYSMVVIKIAGMIQSWAMAKKTNAQVINRTVTLDGKVISVDDTGDFLRTAVEQATAFMSRNGVPSKYLHTDGAKLILDAVKAEISRRENPEKGRE